MKYVKNTREGKIDSRAGQSMTSLLVGLAIMGCVGAGAATISRSSSIQGQTLSAKNGAAELMDTLTDEIRTQTRYSDLAGKYGGTGEGGTGWKTLDGDGAGSESDEFIVRTTVRKTCNASPSTNCDATHVDIEIVDKSTGEVVLKQTVTRTYTHYEEPHALSTLGSLVVPEDSIAVRYISDGATGNDGSSHTAYGYDLKINSEACPYDYQPNSASPRPNGCERCPDGDWKQYHNGDCTLGRCDIGYKANAAKNGCEAITCPSGQKLSGDNCVAEHSYVCYPRSFSSDDYGFDSYVTFNCFRDGVIVGSMWDFDYVCPPGYTGGHCGDDHGLGNKCIQDCKRKYP